MIIGSSLGGTAALATAITLPLCLTRKPKVVVDQENRLVSPQQYRLNKVSGFRRAPDLAMLGSAIGTAAYARVRAATGLLHAPHSPPAHLAACRRAFCSRSSSWSAPTQPPRSSSPCVR